MIDQGPQIGAAALAVGPFEDQAIQPDVDQIFVERAIVLEIDFGAAAADLVERRLGNEEVAGLDQLGHLAVEEGQQKRADVGAVDVGVGHDHDLVIAQLLEAEFLAADAGAERLDDGADLARREHAVEPRPLDVEDLAAQRQDRLILAVPRLLGRAAGAVALDQEQLRFGGVLLGAIVELAGQRRDAHHRFAARLARFARRFARGGGVDHFLDDHPGVRRILLQPFGELVGDQAFQRLADFGRDQFILGLRAELGVGQLDRDDRGQALAHVLAGQIDLFALQGARFLGVIVERPRHRRPERGQMRAAVALRDVVGERQDVFVIAVVPLHRDVDADLVALAVDGDRVGDQAGSWRGRDI